MKKFTIYAGIQILVFLCILWGYQGLTRGNAWAADEPLNENVTVSSAEESFNNASETRDKALELLSLILAQKALEEAEKATSQLTALSQDNRLWPK